MLESLMSLLALASIAVAAYGIGRPLVLRPARRRG